MCYVSLYIVFQTTVVGMEKRGRGRVMVVTEWEGERKGENKFVLVRHRCTVCMPFHFMSCSKNLSIRGVHRPMDKS